MHTVFEASDTDVQVVEYGQPVFLVESVKVDILILHVRTTDRVNPLGLQNAYVGSFFGRMSAFGSIDVANYQMCHVGGQVETVNSPHASRKVIELVLLRQCESGCCVSRV